MFDFFLLSCFTAPFLRIAASALALTLPPVDASVATNAAAATAVAAVTAAAAVPAQVPLILHGLFRNPAAALSMLKITG